MGNGCRAPPFLTSVLNDSEWSASGPGGFTSWEMDPGNQWIGDCKGPSSGGDAAEKRKTICLCWESKSGNPAYSPSLYQLSYCGCTGRRYLFNIHKDNLGLIIAPNTECKILLIAKKTPLFMSQWRNIKYMERRVHSANSVWEVRIFVIAQT
jgi:hypothetical protein